MLAAVHVHLDKLADTDAILFVDNEAACAALIRGSSKESDVSAIANAVQWLAAASGSSRWPCSTKQIPAFFDLMGVPTLVKVALWGSSRRYRTAPDGNWCPPPPLSYNGRLPRGREEGEEVVVTGVLQPEWILADHKEKAYQMIGREARIGSYMKRPYHHGMPLRI